MMPELLQVENVTKTFGGLIALSNLSFSVGAGEIVGLIGPNGSGKSTAFNIITGLFPPTAGKVLLAGENITRLPAHAVATRGVARTFQLVRPFLHLTALQNVVAGRMYGYKPTTSRSQADKEAQELLAMLGLADKGNLKAAALTVMERKRLELARCLATRPKLLLLDEFMAGLAPIEVQTAIEMIARLRTQGLSIVVVEHIIRAVMQLCDRIIVLNAGQKIAEGPPTDIVHDSAVIAAYLGNRYARSEKH
jgi:branched-chain amino acid transport system ATP-binding protein